jgi:hypothetical protein
MILDISDSRLLCYAAICLSHVQNIGEESDNKLLSSVTTLIHARLLDNFL